MDQLFSNWLLVVDGNVTDYPASRDPITSDIVFSQTLASLEAIKFK